MALALAQEITCGLIGYSANNSGAVWRQTVLRYAGSIIFEPDYR